MVGNDQNYLIYQKRQIKPAELSSTFPCWTNFFVGYETTFASIVREGAREDRIMPQFPNMTDEELLTIRYFIQYIQGSLNDIIHLYQMTFVTITSIKITEFWHKRGNKVFVGRIKIPQNEV